MKIIDLIQGTPEWHAHRAAHWNASDAPAMLGVSPYKTRAQLLREYATGIVEEVDPATQRRFDEGHRLEAEARPLAEQIIGEELYPCVGVNGRYSASFDGLTMLHNAAFEHKTLNAELREAIRQANAFGEPLPIAYRVQMEHQCMVSGAERVLFMASVSRGDLDPPERYFCWYTPDPELRARIVAGWEQFERDLEELRAQIAAGEAPFEQAPAAVGRAPEQLPKLRIEVTCMVTASNLAEFKAHAIAVFRGIRTDLQTDQDFADAEQAVKWCGDIEGRLKAAKDAALSQTQSIEALFRAIDEISGEARAKRLELDRLVKSRKETVRAEIVERARNSVADHIASINATLGGCAIGIPAGLTAQIGAAIKGKKTLASITDAANTAAANAKIEASQQAERVRACIAVLAEFDDHAHLFPDRMRLCSEKAPEDLRNLARARVAEHEQREQARLDAERERIRREEEERARREAEAKAVDPVPAPQLPAAPPAKADPLPSTDGATIRLGQINARIAPMTITAEGLATLGFNPVGNERSAKLYAEADFPAIVAAMIRVLRSATVEV